SAASRYARWRQRPRGQMFELEPFAVVSVRAVVDRALAAGGTQVWLSPEDVAAVLCAVGIGYAPWELTTPEEAAGAAARPGCPLVAKLVSPDVVHKTEAGGVVLGLESAGEVSRAASALAERARVHGARFQGILLQREVRGGIEALVGVTTDDVFGPLLLCGL